MGSEVTYSEGKLTPLQELYLRPNAKHGRQEERNLAMSNGERVEKWIRNTSAFSSLPF